MNHVTITRASPMTTIQDGGRTGFLALGISASGPMDRSSFDGAQTMAGQACGAAMEIGPLGLDFLYSGQPLVAGLDGRGFTILIDGRDLAEQGSLTLRDGQAISIRPDGSANYGYIRFAAEIDVPLVLGSRATNANAGIGGLKGRGLISGDEIALMPLPRADRPLPPSGGPRQPAVENAPFRFVWGLHADLFSPSTRAAFSTLDFRISPEMDRMGVCLSDPHAVFAQSAILGLVSDPIVCGDIQILGNGKPVVLMRDHQPTGGYPRIATLIDADLDRFAQTRPGQSISFQPVTVERAHRSQGYGR